MIYIIRHQQGEHNTNCLSSSGVRHTKRIADILLKKINHNQCFRSVYTLLPEAYKHIRPIQTASLLCSYMNRQSCCYSVVTCKNTQVIANDLLKISDLKLLDIIIVWHHGDMGNLVDALVPYYKTFITWPDTNYDGCVQIDLDQCTVCFKKDFFKKPSGCLQKFAFFRW